jgi:hypothetical protein
MPERHDMVEREVRANDPNLSPAANRLLTEELREAVGSDRVRLPAEQAPDAGQIEGSGHSTLTATLSANRLLLGITFLALIIVGVIIALATGSWWAVVAACGVHAVGTVLVATLALRLSTEVERMAPSAAARLEEEGVADPDRMLSDLVEHYAPTAEAHGTAEVVSTGHNRITTLPDEDPVRSTVEQKTAITPAGSPVGPSGDTGVPMLLPILAVAGSLIMSVVAAIALGGKAWLAAALMVGSSLAWLALVRHMDSDGEEHPGERPPGPDRQPRDSSKGRRTRLLPTVVIVAAAVMAGVILVGETAGYL